MRSNIKKVPRYSKNRSQVSVETQNEAMSAAKATQKPGQTKEQTKLIAKGIQKGIEHYKKQQKSKARELDKRLKKAKDPSPSVEIQTEGEIRYKQHLLPWGLLVVSWLLFTIYVLLTN